MDYCKIYFGKSLTDLKYQDIENFFKEEKEESDKIEFKSFVQESNSIREKWKGVIRGICAFLNSEGGILIWGSPQGQKNNIDSKKTEIYKGELSPVNEFFEKDSIISKVSDSITPLPRSINVQPLKKEKNYLYVFEVQRSDYPPHQFRDIFYMRIDGQSKPAPYHYVEALFKQIKYPHIEGYIVPENFQLTSDNFHFRFKLAFFNQSKYLNAYDLYYRFLCTNGTIEGHHQSIGSRPIPDITFGLNGKEKRTQNAKDVFYYGEPLVKRETIILSFEDIKENDGKLKIILLFGTRLSPMKKSVYKFKIAKSHNPNDLKQWITEKRENILMSDDDEEDPRSDQKIREILDDL